MSSMSTQPTGCGLIMTEAELYREAAKVLRKSGWCQGEYHDKHGHHCLLGAMGVVAEVADGRFYYDDNPVPALKEVVGEPICFNDQTDQTAEDVIAALEIAADLAS